MPALSPIESWRLHGVVLALLVAGAWLRLPFLDALPSPAGDETNWLTLAATVARGETPVLPPDAAFVPPTFAHLLGLGVRALGPTFAATRSALAVAFLLGVVGVYALARRTGLRWGAVALVALLCLHPWPVGWTRVAAVPYALGVLVAVAGPLAWWAALQCERPWPRTAALVAAGQLLVLGLHFSPLGGLPLLACGLWLLLPPHRALLRTLGPWLALVGIGLHAWPLLVGALKVASSTSGTAVATHWIDTGPRVTQLLAVTCDGVSGLATLRHFALGPCAWSFDPTLALRVVWLAALVGAVWQAIPRAPRWEVVTSLLVAVAGLPLLLLPTRTWWLPTIDAERYLFVVLAPAWLLVARLAESPGRTGWLAAALVALATLPTAVGVQAAMATGGPDCGLHVADGGGGWRGFRAVAGADGRPQGQAEAVWQAADRAAGGKAYTLVAHDWFGQQTLGWPPSRLADGRHALVWMTQARWPVVAMGRTVVVPVYSSEVFGPGFQPAETLTAAGELRAQLRERVADLHRATVLTDPGGAPLWEIWVGRAR